jgi:predicted dehydrogenase
MLEARRIFREHMTNPKPCPWRFDREGATRPRKEGDGVAGMLVRVNDDWWSWKGWVFDPTQAPHGAMLFEMVHFTDVCNWFMASEPDEVMALEASALNRSVAIRYKTGEMASIVMCENGTFGYPKELYEMMGNGGIVVCDHMLELRTAGIQGAPERKLFPMVNDRHPDVGREGGVSGWLAKKRMACAEATAKHHMWKIFTAEPDKGHKHAINRFVDEIRGTGPMVCGVDDAIAATRVAFAAIKSTHERRVVKMSEV